MAAHWLRIANHAAARQMSPNALRRTTRRATVDMITLPGPVSYRCPWALISLSTQSSAGMTRWDPGPGP